MASVYHQDPDERIDYLFDFQPYLLDGDTIVSAVATISGGTATTDGVSTTSTTVKVWVEGGTVGEVNRLVARATTTQGRVKEMVALIKIRETI